MGEAEAKIVPPLSPARHSSVEGQANASNENWTMPTSRIGGVGQHLVPAAGRTGRGARIQDARAAAKTELGRGARHLNERRRRRRRPGAGAALGLLEAKTLPAGSAARQYPPAVQDTLLRSPPGSIGADDQVPPAVGVELVSASPCCQRRRTERRWGTTAS